MNIHDRLKARNHWLQADERHMESCRELKFQIAPGRTNPSGNGLAFIP